MNLYFWQDVAHVSARHHDRGGVLVAAESLQRAREMISAELPKPEPCEWFCETPCDLHVRETRVRCSALVDDPTAVWSIFSLAPEELITCPNAGCC